MATYAYVSRCHHPLDDPLYSSRIIHSRSLEGYVLQDYFSCLFQEPSASTGYSHIRSDVEAYHNCGLGLLQFCRTGTRRSVEIRLERNYYLHQNWHK